MIIDIIVPVSTDIWNRNIENTIRQDEQCDEKIRVRNLSKGPVSIESEYEEVLVAPYVVELAAELEKKDSDGIVIYCFGEPGLVACKEKLDIPIVGLRETAISMAQILGDRIGVISTINNAVQKNRRILKNQVYKIVAVELPVLRYTDSDNLEKRLEEKIEELIREECNVIVLGCGSMLNIDFKKLQSKYNIPIIIPLNAALAICKYLIKNNLSQSKLAYPKPPKKEIK